MHQARILKEQGLKQVEIAEILQVSDRMVRNYLSGHIKTTPYPNRGSLLDSFKDYIKTILEENPFFNVIVLQDRIKNMGYTGGITILREFAALERKSHITKAVLRFETEPGFQAQVDWKEAGFWEINGVQKKLYAFVILLGFSRKAFVFFTTDMKQQTLLACHLKAFEYFNGMPKEILYDNMKTAWLCQQGEWKVNPVLLDFSLQCGFVPKRCQVRRPQTKGKVERFIRYLGGNFFPRAKEMNLETLDDLNEAINQWLSMVDDKIIRDFCETRNERFEQEQPLLKGFIKEASPDISIKTEVCVNREGYVRFQTNRYSVPAIFLGKTITIKQFPLSTDALLEYRGQIIRQLTLLPEGQKKSHILESDRKELYELWHLQNCKQKKTMNDVIDTRIESNIGLPYNYDDVEVRHPAHYDKLLTEVGCEYTA